MLTPQVIEWLNKFILDEDVEGLNIHYDATGRTTSVESIRRDGKVRNRFQRNELASWVIEPCDAFIEWVGVDDGDSVYYSPWGPPRGN